MQDKILQYNVIVPSSSGCISYGKNLGEAREMAIDAIKGTLMSIVKSAGLSKRDLR